MTLRICPECDTRTEATLCPRCGSRTLAERRKEERADPMVGRILDERYRVESLIGRGGMGSVYRGVQLATKQVVAIKVIRAEHAEDTESAKRFHREARAASLLTYFYTVRVFDFGQSADGDLYMVMEHLNGRTLSQARKAGGRFAEVLVAKIACEVCQSLAEAHAYGLAHRDLKPDNVMLLDTVGDPDFVKVLDFGIAKFLSGSSSGESSVTRTGAVVGTPHYMSPEQAQGGRNLTPAVDVYALGVMIWEALAGEKPFDGDSALSILMAHSRQPAPDLPAECPVSPAMRALVARLLGKAPAARPGAAELVRAFDVLRMQATLASTVPGGPGARDAQASATASTAPGTKAGMPAAWPDEAAVPEAEVESTVAMSPHGTPPVRRTLPMETAEAPPPQEASRGFTGSASVEMLPAGRRRAPPVVAGLAAVGITALGIWLAWPEAAPPDAPAPGSAAVTPTGVSRPAAPVDERSPATSVPAQPSRPEPAPAPTILAVPRVRFESEPPGASVRLDDRDIGTTPFETALPGQPGDRTFVFRKAGYQDAAVTNRVAAGARIAARLERKPAAASPRPVSAPKVVPKAEPKPEPRKKFLPVDD